MTSTEVLEKYFNGEKYIYFTGSDKMEMSASGHYISYEKNGGIMIYRGSNDGEILIGVYNDMAVLDKLLEILIFKS